MFRTWQEGVGMTGLRDYWNIPCKRVDEAGYNEDGEARRQIARGWFVIVSVIAWVWESGWSEEKEP